MILKHTLIEKLGFARMLLLCKGLLSLKVTELRDNFLLVFVSTKDWNKAKDRCACIVAKLLIVAART